MHKTICPSVDDGVQVGCSVGCGSDHGLRLSGGIRRLEAEELGE
jgi:hypothetical protein